MNNQKEDQKLQHPQEQLLEAVVINCQHIAAICKGLCVKGVSYDVSVKELERHKNLNTSDSHRVLKEECLRCQSVLSDCVIQLDKLKRQYLADYNKNDDLDTRQQQQQQLDSSYPQHVHQHTPSSTPASMPTPASPPVTLSPEDETVVADPVTGTVPDTSPTAPVVVATGKAAKKNKKNEPVV